MITEIKTGGYYFTLDYSKDKEGKSIDAILLFQNGTIKELGRISSKSASEYFKKRCAIPAASTYESSRDYLQCMLDNYEYYFKIKTNFLNRNAQIWNWGKFEILNGYIKIQYFYNYKGDYYLTEENGELIDSASFVIKSVFDYKTKKRTNVNIFYAFYEHNVKDILKYSPGNTKLVTF